MNIEEFSLPDCSTKALRKVAGSVSSDYVLLRFGAGGVSLADGAVGRFMSVAADCGADMVYSDRYEVLHGGESEGCSVCPVAGETEGGMARPVAGKTGEVVAGRISAGEGESEDHTVFHGDEAEGGSALHGGETEGGMARPVAGKTGEVVTGRISAGEGESEDRTVFHGDEAEGGSALHDGETEGRLVLHPVIDWQEGALRDDFDFGNVLVFNSASFKAALAQMTVERIYAGLYELRLRMRSIVHIPEPLYTYDPRPSRLSSVRLGAEDGVDVAGKTGEVVDGKAVNGSARPVSGKTGEVVAGRMVDDVAGRMVDDVAGRAGTGDDEGKPLREKQFSYVDPRNKDVQTEMESVCTAHLSRIGALLPPQPPASPVSLSSSSPLNSSVSSLRGGGKRVGYDVVSCGSDYGNGNGNDCEDVPCGHDGGKGNCGEEVSCSPEYPVTASVIIPVYNRVNTIADAVRSALSQVCDFPFNVIVVDNHSTDGTSEVLQRLCRENEGCEGGLCGGNGGQRHGVGRPRLEVIVPEGMGLGIGGCWNLAVNSPACGEFCVQLDSDDLYSSGDTLAKIVALFRAEGCAMVVGSYMLCDFNLNPIPPGVIDHREWTEENGRNNALRINGLGAPRAFRTSILRSMGGFPNVSYGEDYAVGLRISREYRIGRIYDVLYLCRRWGGNSDSNPSLESRNAHDLYKDRLRTVELRARISLNKRLHRAPATGQGEIGGTTTAGTDHETPATGQGKMPATGQTTGQGEIGGTTAEKTNQEGGKR